MEKLIVNDKSFEIYINESEILERVKGLAHEIALKEAQHKPVFLAVLNGSFMFAADLLKQINFNCEIQFIKASSYSGTTTTGNLNVQFGLNQDLAGRHVILLEDIVDTGTTIVKLKSELEKLNPASIKICTLLFKPERLVEAIKPDYTGFIIENKFVVGYGLDYNGAGRNLRHLYSEAN